MSSWLGGDPTDDLGQLYDRVGPSLYRYALMILADPAAAEDVVHDVFVALALRRRRSVRTLEAYARRAVRNGCYDLIRRERVRDIGTSDPLLLERADADAADPGRRLDLERALAALGPEQREVVHLKVFEGRTLQEIADFTEVPLNTVASRYRYALTKLRATLGAEVPR